MATKMNVTSGSFHKWLKIEKKIHCRCHNLLKVSWKNRISLNLIYSLKYFVFMYFFFLLQILRSKKFTLEKERRWSFKSINMDRWKISNIMWFYHCIRNISLCVRSLLWNLPYPEYSFFDFHQWLSSSRIYLKLCIHWYC